MNGALFPVKSDAYAAILPSRFPDVPNEGGRLNTMFDGYKASDSDTGWCWSVERTGRPVVTLGGRQRFKPIRLHPG
jgi:hypothetical protein